MLNTNLKPRDKVRIRKGFAAMPREYEHMIGQTGEVVRVSQESGLVVVNTERAYGAFLPAELEKLA